MALYDDARALALSIFTDALPLGAQTDVDIVTVTPGVRDSTTLTTSRVESTATVKSIVVELDGTETGFPRGLIEAGDRQVLIHDSLLTAEGIDPDSPGRHYLDIGGVRYNVIDWSHYQQFLVTSVVVRRR